MVMTVFNDDFKKVNDIIAGIAKQLVAADKNIEIVKKHIVDFNILADTDRDIFSNCRVTVLNNYNEMIHQLKKEKSELQKSDADYREISRFINGYKLFVEKPIKVL